jgi:hypothetical protein
MLIQLQSGAQVLQRQGLKKRDPIG